MSQNVTKALGEKFSFKIANASGVTKVIALLAAFFDTLDLAITLVEGTPNTETHVISYKNPAAIVAAGYTCDGVLDDGTIIAGVVCTPLSAKNTIRQFRDYVKANPLVCIDMIIQATIPAQFNEIMEVISCSPLSGNIPKELELNNFKSVDQFATDKIIIPGINLQMAYDTLMLLPVPTGCTTTVTFKFS